MWYPKGEVTAIDQCLICPCCGRMNVIHAYSYVCARCWLVQKEATDATRRRRGRLVSPLAAFRRRSETLVNELSLGHTMELAFAAQQVAKHYEVSLAEAEQRLLSGVRIEAGAFVFQMTVNAV